MGVGLVWEEHWIKLEVWRLWGAPPLRLPSPFKLLGHLLLVAKKIAQAEGLKDGYRLGEWLFVHESL